MTADFSLVPFPLSEAFKLILDAQPDDAGKLEAAIKVAETSVDPMTKAAGIFYVQRFYLNVANPGENLDDIHSIAAAQQRLDFITANDPAACDRIREYFGAVLS